MKLETDVGRLDKRITIQKMTSGDQFDSIGNQLEPWADYHSCWAGITGGKGSESQQAKEPSEVQEKTFKIRYCQVLEDLNSTEYRIKYKNRIYNISAVDNLAEADSLYIIRATKEKR